MTAEQAEELRSKKRPKERQTDEEKWAWIYRILFGRNLGCTPSPCRLPCRLKFPSGIDEQPPRYAGTTVQLTSLADYSTETDDTGYYRISRCQMRSLRAHNPPPELKLKFERGVGEVVRSISGRELKRISELACDYMAGIVEHYNGVGDDLLDVY